MTEVRGRLDWFTHNQDLDAETAALLSVEIDHVVAVVCDLASARTDSPLYLTGSLGRQEACGYTEADGRVVFGSDFDFVLLVEADETGQEIYRLASELLPGTELSVFTVAPHQVPYISGGFGADLAGHLRQPLLGEPWSGPALDPPFGLRERLEVIAHQASNYLFSPGVFGAQAADRRHTIRKVKLAAEALRASSPVAGSTLQAAADHARTVARTDSEVADIDKLASARLRGDNRLVDQGTVHRIVLEALARLVSCPPQADRVAAALDDVYRGRDEVVDVYQLSCLELCLARTDGQDSMLGRQVGSIVGQRLDNSSTTSLDLATVESAILRLRPDYYKAIGDHNFGRHSLKGYAL